MKDKFTPLLLMQEMTLKYSEGWHGDAMDMNTLTAPRFLVQSCAWVAEKIFHFDFFFFLSPMSIYETAFTLTVATVKNK